MDGRLRQGWGTDEGQNLEVIAAAIKAGQPLTEAQQDARLSVRMLTSWEQGMSFGDVIVAPNLPDYGRLSIFRLAGSYEWSRVAPRRFGERFGHILPVELLVGDIGRHEPVVSEGLRIMLGLPTRLCSITSHGGDVERVLGNPAPQVDSGGPWTEAQYERLFGRFTPTGPTPSDDDVSELAAELGRTPGAISWQWQDGAAYCTGRSASTTSEALKSWLDRRGLVR